MCLRSAHHALPPPVLDDRLRGFRPWAVEPVEWSRRKVAIKYGAVGCELGLQSVEHVLWKAARVGRCFHHQRWHCRHDSRLRHPTFAMPCQIVHDLAASGGMANVDCILEIKMSCERR